MERPLDLDATRASVQARGLLADASTHLTSEIAMALSFDELGPFKTALKKFFSAAPWTDDDIEALSDLVTSHVSTGWWEHQLDDEIRLVHGITAGRYVLWVTGVDQPTSSTFDRVFAGPVIPEPTPHPRKVKFSTGGAPSPGIWYRPGDEIDEPGVRVLLDEPDITDVMVAGDFVTIGLARSSAWEDRLDAILELVTELFPHGEIAAAPRTREELIVEGRELQVQPRPEELHLLDPDDVPSRVMLLDALDAGDARIRRVAVAILAESRDDAIKLGALERGWGDDSRIVRRAAIDSAADEPDERVRALFETGLGSDDEWIRWKAVRALGVLGGVASIEAVKPLQDDPDFRVRFEVARVLKQ